MVIDTVKQEGDMHSCIEADYSDESFSTQASYHWITNEITEAHQEVQREHRYDFIECLHIIGESRV